MTLLLNHVVLAAGEAMYLSTEMIHAYTSGFGVEIVAASDNVLRADLTQKFIDRTELLETTKFPPCPPPLCEAASVPRVRHGVLTPARGFELVVVDLIEESLRQTARDPDPALPDWRR